MAIEKGNWIKVSYTGKLKDGAVFDSSEGKEPIVFEVGAGSVIKGFDENVVGMKVGDKKEFTIPCKEAYGEQNDDNKEEVPTDFFKDVEKLEVGVNLIAQSPMGPLKVKVLALDEATKKATVSINHPLAGEDLTFNIEIVGTLDEKEAETYKAEMIKKQEEMKKEYEKMQKQHNHDKKGDCGEEGCGSCSGKCE